MRLPVGVSDRKKKHEKHDDNVVVVSRANHEEPRTMGNGDDDDEPPQTIRKHGTTRDWDRVVVTWELVRACMRRRDGE